LHSPPTPAVTTFGHQQTACSKRNTTQNSSSVKNYCHFLSSVIITELQNHSPAQVGRDLERSSGPTFHGNGSLDEVTQYPVQLSKEHAESGIRARLNREILSI